MWRRLRFVIPGLLLLATLGIRVVDPWLLAELRAEVFDVFQHLKPRTYKPSPVRIIDLDNESLRRFGQWPWPRTEIANLVKRLNAMGAAAIAFDMVFAEPDRTSPAQVSRLLGDSPELAGIKGALAALPDHDQQLAQAIKAARVVTGFALTVDENEARPRVKRGFATAGDDPRQFLASYRGAVTNLTQIEEAALGNGTYTVKAERGGVIRRLPLVLRLDNVLYPSLAAEALRVAQGAAAYVIKSSGAHGIESFGQHTGISTIRVGAVPIPTDPAGAVWLYDSGPVPDRVIPAWRILEGQIKPDAIRGMILFIGSSAAGIQDVRASPLQPAVAGFQLHAQLLEQILHHDYLRRSDLADGLELTFLLVVSGILIIVVRHVGAIRCAILGGLMVAAVIGFSWYAFSARGLLFDPIYPSLASLLVYLSASFFGYLYAEVERRRVRNAFSHYVSPVMVERLAADPSRLKLGGEMREVSILFCDIRNFTHISERLGAEELVRLLNEFLTPMTDIILRHEGTIDKYIGDCIMAFWNAPLDDPRHASHMCAAALAMRERLQAFNAEAAGGPLAAREVLPLRMGIGLNAGTCCVGNVGSAQRFDYSVLGDAVNVASRLEGLTKSYGVGIIAGDAIRQQATDFAMLEIDVMRVKGRAEPTRIHALLGDRELAQSPAFRDLAAAHERLLEAYRAADRYEAERRLADCRRLDPGGRLAKLYDVYEQRIAALETHAPARDDAPARVAQ
jgi:adenylate cyclase